jgi:alpha-N-acetylglucosaminidase
MLKADPLVHESPLFRHDIVDLGRQALSDLVFDVRQVMISSFADKDPISFLNASSTLLDIADRLDALLSTHPSFLLSSWIQDARLKSPSGRFSDLFEFNARNQITLWGPHGEVGDYASKVSFQLELLV